MRINLVERGARAAAFLGAAALAGCGNGGPPPATTQSVIATAVSEEYRRFIEDSAADLGVRRTDTEGRVEPVSDAPAGSRLPGAQPISPPQVEALPTDAGGFMGLWHRDMTRSLFDSSRTATFEVDEVLDRMLARSNQVAAFADLPLIRDTTVRQEWAVYDPILFAEGEVESLERVRSSTLDTGVGPGAPTNLEEDGLKLRLGLRQQLLTGGTVTLTQEAGQRSSNSQFFVPNPQSDAEWRIEIRQPLLEGAGVSVNLAPVEIAQIERDQSVAEFQRQVETQLIEVIRAYWVLYEERGRVILRERTTGALGAILATLNRREAFDALPSETAQARAAFQSARSSIVRARAGVRNAEARLAALLSDPSIFGEQVEVIPAQPPVRAFADVPLEDVARLAIENRPELRSAALQLRAAEVRRRVALNRLLPELEAYGALYNGGLTDGNNLPGAFSRTTGQTDPDYVIGLRLEVPLGNNEDRALYDRRRLEVRQLTSQLRNVIDTVLLESQIAVREARTAYEEMRARERELSAVDAQVVALGERLGGGVEAGPAFLNTYLGAVEQQGGARERLLEAAVAYNLALYTLERVAGTLLETRGIGASRVQSGTLDYIAIVRGEGPGRGVTGDIFTNPSAAAIAPRAPLPVDAPTSD